MSARDALDDPHRRGMDEPPDEVSAEWSSWRVWGTDVLLAGALVGTHLSLVALSAHSLWPDSWAPTLGWSAACAVPVVLRRWAPWVAVALGLAVLGAAMIVGQYPATHVFGLVVLTYSTAARLRLRSAVTAAVLLWLPVNAVSVLDETAWNPLRLSPAYLVLDNAVLAVVAFLIGRTVHTRRAFTRSLQQRARAAEANQRAVADAAVADERRRIARELHDVVAHHVSVMGVLATGARRVLRSDVDAADEALATIEGTGRTALREMRRLLNVLRSDAEEPTPELAPQPGVAGIAVLVEQLREAGLPVQLRVDGSPGQLAPGVALSIYRIVQEALTNILKHAGTASAEVRLSFGVYWIIVEVLDDGRGAVPGADAGAGHGLVGMRERVALYGGTLRTGPRPGGGFQVHAKIPVEDVDERR